MSCNFIASLNGAWGRGPKERELKFYGRCRVTEVLISIGLWFLRITTSVVNCDIESVDIIMYINNVKEATWGLLVFGIDIIKVQDVTDFDDF